MNAFTSEQYLRDFFDHAPIGFHLFGPDRVFLDINQVELVMIGYTYDEVVGRKTWADLIVPEEKPLFERHWQELQARGKVSDLRYTVITKQGPTIRVLLNATAKLDGNGLIHTRGSVQDITQKEKAEAELRVSESELRRQKDELAKKNAALQEILAHIEKEKNRIKEQVMANIDHLILPMVTKLRRKGSPLDRRHVALLEKNLRELTSGFGSKIVDRKWRLAARELEICNMIGSGLSTKEIAEILKVSVRTVDNHRHHIRKKLNITHQNINLSTYLRSL